MSGIDWQNGVAVATVGGITAVCLGCLVWAIGTTTGDIATQPTPYHHLMQLFGGLRILPLGSLALIALL